MLVIPVEEINKITQQSAEQYQKKGVKKVNKRLVYITASISCKTSSKGVDKLC